MTWNICAREMNENIRVDCDIAETNDPAHKFLHTET